VIGAGASCFVVLVLVSVSTKQIMGRYSSMTARDQHQPASSRALVVSGATVKTHVNRVIAKLGGPSRAQLVVLAYESGLVRPGDHAGRPAAAAPPGARRTQSPA
jgi:hypothetical protein